MPAIAGEWSTTGGLSGPAMRWIVNARIWEVANWAAQECPDFVISGLGGAKTWDHALSFFGYGASHAQFCTVLMDEQPEPVLERLQAGALAWMGENGYDSFDEVPGFAVSHVVKHSVAVGHSQAYRAGSVSRRAAAAPQAPEGGDDIVAESAALTARNDN